MAENTAQVSALARVQAYHERSKHRLGAYAAGPETLDWDAQPDPFRRFAGAPLAPLPLKAADGAIGWNQLFEPGREAFPANLAQIGRLFECSFALSAWKELGPDRWALRVNPSSGNLHPTEVYLVAQGLPDLADGLYHYAPKEHALEQRAAFAERATAPRLLVGFSSIHWREAWKYGERAFRYCQLDMGHAIGACATPPPCWCWRLRLAWATANRRAHGLDRSGDFRTRERRGRGRVRAVF
jgi:hypothetical protein